MIINLKSKLFRINLNTVANLIEKGSGYDTGVGTAVIPIKKYPLVNKIDKGD